MNPKLDTVKKVVTLSAALLLSAGIRTAAASLPVPDVEVRCTSGTLTALPAACYDLVCENYSPNHAGIDVYLTGLDSLRSKFAKTLSSGGLVTVVEQEPVIQVQPELQYWDSARGWLRLRLGDVFTIYDADNMFDVTKQRHASKLDVGPVNLSGPAISFSYDMYPVNLYYHFPITTGRYYRVRLTAKAFYTDGTVSSPRSNFTVSHFAGNDRTNYYDVFHTITMISSSIDGGTASYQEENYYGPWCKF